MEEPIKIKSINLFSSWVYNLPKNTDCTICRCNLNLSSLYNQEKGIDSYVVSGACNHSFHFECIKPWVEKNNYCPICFSEWQYNKKPVEDPYTTLVDKIIVGNDEAQAIINDAQSIIDKYKNTAIANKFFSKKTGEIEIDFGENGINKITPAPDKFLAGFSKKVLTKELEIESKSGPKKCDCVTCTKSININDYIKEKISNKFKSINIDL